MSLSKKEMVLSSREIGAIRAQFDEFTVKTYYVVALDEAADEISINPSKFLTPFLAQQFIEKMKAVRPEQKYVIVSQKVCYSLEAIVPPSDIESFVINSTD